jgi:diaminopimelate epimerase
MERQEALVIDFEKYHGLGNDFIIVEKNLMDKAGIAVKEYPDFTRKYCNRTLGIGADC